MTPGYWGVLLGVFVVVATLFYGYWRDEQQAAADDERRHRHLSDDEIDEEAA